MAIPTDQRAELEELVRKYKVCWEVQKHVHFDAEHNKSNVGYEIELGAYVNISL